MHSYLIFSLKEYTYPMIFPLGISFGRPQLLADEIDKNLKQIRISVNNFRFQSYNRVFLFHDVQYYFEQDPFWVKLLGGFATDTTLGKSNEEYQGAKMWKKIQRDLTIGIFQRFRKVKFPKSTALFNEKMDI